jgi:hypothetical protein
MKALEESFKKAVKHFNRRFGLRPVNIVKHRTGWCATFRNSKPSKLALHDKTACGYVIHLRWGQDVGLPDCPECLKVLSRRRENRLRKR